MPQKLLLNMGKIKPSPEAIDRHMDVGETLLDIGKKKLMNIATENIYYAAINPSQSALMLQGYPPSIPRETIRLLEEVFVKEKKLMTMKDVNVIKNAFKVYKDFEHGKIKEISGKEIDLMMKDVSAYVKKIKGIVRELEKASLKEGKTKLLNSINTSLTNLMVVEGLSKTKTELKNNFSKLVRKGHFTKEEQTLLQKTMEGVKKSSSKEELNKYRRESALIRKKILNHIQRDKEKELKKARIKIKYDGKMGELYVLDKIVYMVGVIDKGIKAVTKAKLMPNGGLGMPRPSTVEELEKVISEIKIDKNTFIKEALFEDLKKIFGSDVEVMIGE